MNVMKKALVALSATGATLTGLALGGGMASADPEASLQLDKTSVAPGDTVNVVATCGAGEGVNMVGSEAFAPTGQDGPYTGNGGTAVFGDDQRGDEKQGIATIRDVGPGTYHVGQRCGGGNAGGLEIHVLP